MNKPTKKNERGGILDELIEEKIYLIRDEKVMLDRDLAALYGVETKVLNQAVKRNLDRFPEDFMFQLTKTEEDALRSQNVTLKRGEHSKYSSHAFTENGVAMLSSVLNSDRAIQVNIQIMRTFTRLKKVMGSHKEILSQLNKHAIKLLELDKRTHKIFEVINAIVNPPVIEKKKKLDSYRRTRADCFYRLRP